MFCLDLLRQEFFFSFCVFLGPLLFAGWSAGALVSVLVWIELDLFGCIL